MGVDIETHRCRIGTFRQGCGTNVCTIEVMVNLTQPFKSIGSLIFIGTLLIMAGIESNPGPKEEEEKIPGVPELSAGTEDVPSNPVGPLFVNKLSDNSVMLTWQSPVNDSSVTAYIIEYKKSTCANWEKIKQIPPTQTWVMVDELIGGYIYYFRVKARNLEGESEPLESDKETLIAIKTGETWLPSFQGLSGKLFGSENKEAKVPLHDSMNEAVAAADNPIEGMLGCGSKHRKRPEDSSNMNARPNDSSEVNARPEGSSEVNVCPQERSEVKASSEDQSEVNTRREDSSEGNVRPEGNSESNAQHEGRSEGNNIPEGSSEVNTRTEESSEGNARTGNTSEVNVGIEGSFESNARTEDSFEGNARTENSSDGNTRTEDSSEGNARTEDSSEGNARTENSSDGKARTEDSSEGNARTENSSEGNARTEDSSDGNARTEDSSEGNARTEEVSEVNAGHEYSSEVNARTQGSCDGKARQEGSFQVNAKIGHSYQRLGDDPSRPVGPLFVNKLSDSSVMLAWQPPVNDSTLTGYIIEYKQSTCASWVKINQIRPTQTSAVVDGLIEGNSYYFRVKAMNIEGESEPLESDKETPLGMKIVKPSAPRGPIQFTDVTDTTVTVTWKPTGNDDCSPIRGYIIEVKETSNTSWPRIDNVPPDKTTCRVQNLKAKQEYIFRVFAENEAGRSDDLVSETVTLKSSFYVPSKPIGPLIVNKDTDNRVALSWHPPESDGGSPLTMYIIEYRQATSLQWEKLGDTRPPETYFRDARITRDNDYHFRVKAVNDEGESETLETEKPTSIRNWIIDYWNLLQTLKLKDKYPGRIAINELLSVDLPSSVDEISHADLPWVMLKKIILSHFDSRDKIIADALGRIYNEAEQESTTDISQCSDKESLSPLNIFNIVIQCCNPFVKSILYKKLYLCKLAVPFCSKYPKVPFCSKYPDCKDKIVSLWPLRSIVIQHNGQDYTALQIPTCTVSVLRIGRPRFSKSKLLNKLLSRNEFDTFFNNECPDGTKERRVSQGNTEVFWLIPEGNDVVKTIFNLRGDVRIDFDESDKNLLSKLTDILCIVVELDEIIEHSDIIDSLIKLVGKTILIVNNPRQCPREQDRVNAFTKNIKTVLTYKGDTEINYLELVKQMHTFLLQYTDEVSIRSLESRLSSKPYKQDDESGEDFLRTKQNSIVIFNMIDQVTRYGNIKEKITPSQCMYSKKLGDLKKVLYRVQFDKQNQINKNIKFNFKNQIEHASPAVKIFANDLIKTNSKSAFELQLFITWMAEHLDTRARKLLPALIKQNQMDFERLWESQNDRNEEKIDEHMRKVKLSSHSIANNLFSVQHLFREIAMLYEACLQTKTVSQTIGLPDTNVMAEMCADLIVRGYPFEILNGDDNNMPYSWIEKVIQKAHTKIGKERVFAISILGIQSSGKSTLLNTMFGSQFPVSAGRCTRGVHVQLLPVGGTFGTDMPFKYVLLIDTEGLRAPELLGDERVKHDNKLATFVAGLGDITLLNTMGEITTELVETLQIVVYAFLRLKLANAKLDLKKRCIFVQHNVIDETAPEKMHQGLQKILTTLNDITKEAASSVGISDIDRFNQVIEFDIKSHIWYFPNLWHGSSHFPRVNEKYSDRTFQLRRYLMNTAIAAAKMKSYKSLADTVTHINDLWKGVLMEDFVFSFRDSLEIKAYTWFEKRFQDILWKAECTFILAVETDTMISFSKCETVDDLANIHTDIKRKMAHLVSEKRAETNETVKDVFENNDFKEIISAWTAHRENRLNFFWADLHSRALSKSERLLNKRKIELQTSSVCKEHEQELYDMSRDLAKKIKKDKINKHDINSHFAKIWAKFENGFPIQRNTKRSVKDIMECTLQAMLHDHVPLLYAQMHAVKWPYVDTSIKRLTGSLEQSGITDDDVSMLYNLKGIIANFKGKLSKIMQDVNIMFTTLDNDIQHKCTSDCEIGETDIKEFLRNIEEWMNHMKEKKTKIGLTLTLNFKIKIFVYAASYATNRFSAQNENYEKEHGVIAHIQRYKKEAKLRLDAMIKDRSAEDTAAILFTSAIRDFARQTIKAKMYAQALKEIHQCIPRPKYNLMIEIVTDLANTGTFEDWISYLSSAKNHASGWVKKKSECHLFGDQSGKYIDLARSEAGVIFDDVASALSKSLENRNKDSVIKTDGWIQLFIESMKKYPITQQKFNNVKIGFDEITPKAINGFSQLLFDELKKCKSDVVKEIEKTKVDTVTWSDSNPYEVSFKRLWGCTETCPFCGETCAKDAIHESSHYCIQHRPSGCIGIHEEDTLEISLTSCNYDIQSELTHRCGVFGYKCNDTEKEQCKEERHKYRDYRAFLPDWDIAPNSNMEETSKIWLWFMSQYKESLRELYNVDVANIPESWNEITKEDAIQSYRAVLGH